MKTKHSFSPPSSLKYGGTFFWKTLFMEDKLFWKNLWGDALHEGLMNRSCQDWRGGRKLFMVFCHSRHIYGTWKNIQVGEGEILKSSFVRQVKKGWDHFLWRELTPRDTMYKFYFDNWWRTRLGKMVKKSGRQRFYLWCTYSFTISFLVKVLLVKLKNLYIQHAWVLIIEKQNSSQKCEGWRDGGIC